MSLLEMYRTVGVVGGGAMGAGIAQVAAVAGHHVKVFDVRAEAADKAVDSIRVMLTRLADKGKMTVEAASAACARLEPVSQLQALADAMFVVEAIVEKLDVKQQLFCDLEGIVSDDCILATNTSSISVTAIGARMRLPQRLAGMHFFNPVPLMELVEVVSGLATDKQVADTVFDLGTLWGKKAVHTKSTPGFIVNRVARPFYAEGLRVATEQAATPATLDAIVRESGGFRMGPFELMDLIGHDVNFAVTSSVFAAYYNDQRFTPSLMQQELVNGGFFGRKSGRGFYQYGDDAPKAMPDTEAPRGQVPGVQVATEDVFAHQIAERFQANGVQVGRSVMQDSALLVCGKVRVYLTDGRTATQRAVDTDYPHVVLLDLAGDYRTAQRVALAPALQCGEAEFSDAVAAFQQAGFTVSRLGDVPGMIVMRTVAMLANEAADAVNQGVCDVAAVDLAMRKGVNYPEGPLAWADKIGVARVCTVLRNVGAVYGEDRYRISPLIQQKVLLNARFYPA